MNITANHYSPQKITTARSFSGPPNPPKGIVQKKLIKIYIFESLNYAAIVYIDYYAECRLFATTPIKSNVSLEKLIKICIFESPNYAAIVYIDYYADCHILPPLP